jgi:hypothetical protein
MRVGVAASSIDGIRMGGQADRDCRPGQRAAFDGLKAIAAKVEEALDMVESRVGAILAAARTSRPG